KQKIINIIYAAYLNGFSNNSLSSPIKKTNKMNKIINNILALAASLPKYSALFLCKERRMVKNSNGIKTVYKLKPEKKKLNKSIFL
ncbi:hypothetical protein MUZ84_004737, partial [Salmonella enterica]|nr:hypothetical protein [Salmonella enterica]